MRRLGGRKARSAALAASLPLLAAACSSTHDQLLTPATCDEPAITSAVVTPNETNVLSAFVTARIAGADSVFVRFGADASLDSVTPALTPASTPAFMPAFSANGDSITIPVYGLLSSRSYGAQLVAFNHCGTAASSVLPFVTGRLPDDLPSYSAAGPEPLPGFVVFGAGNYGLVIDNTGRVVWYHRFPAGPGLNFQVQPNGRYAARPPSAAGTVGSWIEIAPDGRTMRTLACAHGLPARMHDLIAQPDGSYWLLCDEQRTVDLGAQGASAHATVLGTDVQWRSAAGDVLFEWSPFDHLDVDLSVLDPVDRDGSVVNWTHGNSLDLDHDGNVLVSFRNLSEVMKIDIRTGTVLWRMGGRGGTVRLADGGSPMFVHQHGLRATAPGQVMLLDNLGDPTASRAERYEVEAMQRTARLSAAFGFSSGHIAQIGGSVQALERGHVLVSFGNGDGLEEYDAAGTTVWKLVRNPGYVFRAERIRSLYQPGVGDPR